MTKFITINERAAQIAIELVVGRTGLAAILGVYRALNEAEAAGRDEGYNEGFGACLRIVQPDPVEQEPVFTITPDPFSDAEVAAAENVLYGK